MWHFLVQEEVGGHDDAKKLVAEYGLKRLNDFFDKVSLKPFKNKSDEGLEVTLLTLDNEDFYLKRSQKPRGSSFRLFLKWLLRFERPHSEAFHVYLAERVLKSRGISTMEVIAYGERRYFGIWPVSSFMIARGVKGTRISIYFKGECQSAEMSRLRLISMGALGDQMAQLHANGFFVYCRLHDYYLNVTDWVDKANRAPLTMIDLDFKGVRLASGKINWQKAAWATAHSLYLSLRCGVGFSRVEICEWIRCYYLRLEKMGEAIPRNYLHTVCSAFAVQCRQYLDDPELLKNFPQFENVARLTLNKNAANLA